MPTGYTAMIDDNPKMTALEWLIQGLVRAFGICVTLRDSSLDLTEEQIDKELKTAISSDSKYYTENFEKATKRHAEIIKFTDEDWVHEWEKEKSDIERYNKNSQIKAKRLKTRHDKIRKDLEKVIVQSNDDITQNIARYGIEQLNLVQSDEELYITKIPTLEDFINDTRKQVMGDIIYYSDELEKTVKRETERYDAYKKFRKEVRRILEVKEE